MIVTQKVFGAGRACKHWVGNYRTGGHREPQEYSRQGQEQACGGGCERLPGQKGRYRQPMLSSMGWKGNGAMMEFAWNPRVGWLAGAKGTVRPDVCFASWMESTPSGKLCQTSEVSLFEQPLFPKSRWQSPPDPLSPHWGRRVGNTVGTSACAPLVPSEKYLSRGQQQTVCRFLPCPTSAQTWPRKDDPREGNHIPTGGQEMSPVVRGRGWCWHTSSCPRQDGTSASKQNGGQCKGPRGALSENAQESRPGARTGGAPGVGCGEKTLRES